MSRIKEILTEIKLDCDETATHFNHTLPQHQLIINCLKSGSKNDYVAFHNWNNNHLEKELGRIPSRKTSYSFLGGEVLNEIMNEYIELFFLIDDKLKNM